MFERVRKFFKSQEFTTGVIVGITVAVLIGVYGMADEIIQRRQHERHIEYLVSNFTCQMINAADYSELPSELIRFFYYGLMIDELDRSLDIRYTKLRYDTISELWRILPHFVDARDPKSPKVTYKPPSIDVMNDEVIRQLIENVRPVKWLDVDPDACKSK